MIVTAFTQNHSGSLATGYGLPANDLFNLCSEVVRSVMKFVCCADIDLLYISTDPVCFRTVGIFIKHQRKILASLFRGNMVS